MAGLKRPAALASDRLSSAQVSVTGRVARRMARYPRQDDDLTDESALTSLLAGRSWYSDMDVHQRVDYNPDHLKIFRKKLVPRPLAPRLTGDARDLLDGYQSTIERSEQEVGRLLANSDVPIVRPYWAPSLARDPDLRLSFFKKLISLRLGGLRKAIRAKVGFFFVKKKSTDAVVVTQQRMVIDTRVPNLLHKTPPKTRLGSGSALLRVRLDDRTITGMDPHAFTTDLEDSFYQFTDRRLATWFGCEWVFTASTWGVSSVWCDESEQWEEVSPDQLLYFVFEGMPMGWTWAVYFCQAVIEWGARSDQSLFPSRRRSGHFIGRWRVGGRWASGPALAARRSPCGWLRGQHLGHCGDTCRSYPSPGFSSVGSYAVGIGVPRGVEDWEIGRVRWLHFGLAVTGDS